ncbi:hypothetical protein UFOVP908_95 [uncultured Caudovirales phage]|uniref:Uncharacterized protein n=1 Tax=uncultured Caudovirales phage TaxID=2100421 RepID=A0A6J5QKC4_9CAUD|nr:hypothetical protein UFOVP908_95 [uncultured Caudovirales phage]CAB4176517.1 hypothetical protein UFOVP990_41 [uncultured Caudovirales phage]CAB4181901.1 hypothetical protein UFOVP1065_72 [uncultured Caudovirales phage]CAB4190204.1 hypothetical protein UFOVP1198_41 [uncultured Caudovirales phage]CAB4210685.1 hypothetical protein UFOVP1418_33 [uncultured Caudovirales phage]
MTARPVARIGDADFPHASPMVRAVGSSDVFVNARPVSRQFDANTPHLVTPKGPVHISYIAVGSVTVFADSRGVGRILDLLIPVCTAVAQGSPTVFAGG